MHLAFLIVAIVLFIIDALAWWAPGSYGGRLMSVGLAFLAASFLAANHTRNLCLTSWVRPN